MSALCYGVQNNLYDLLEILRKFVNQTEVQYSKFYTCCKISVDVYFKKGHILH